jgi:predicted nucleic acid-binding protein
VKTFVIDASVAVKWVVNEDGTPEALALRKKGKLIAPDLLVAECANVLWKKVQRRELLKEEALLTARLLQHAEIELLPMRSLLETATRISIEVDHPAYDCVYLALAVANACEFVTADDHFVRKLHHRQHPAIGRRAILLREAVKP